MIHFGAYSPPSLFYVSAYVIGVVCWRFGWFEYREFLQKRPIFAEDEGAAAAPVRDGSEARVCWAGVCAVSVLCSRSAARTDAVSALRSTPDTMSFLKVKSFLTLLAVTRHSPAPLEYCCLNCSWPSFVFTWRLWSSAAVFSRASKKKCLPLGGIFCVYTLKLPCA